MNVDKRKLYIISFIILAVLLSVFIFVGNNARIITAAYLTVSAIISIFVIKKRISTSINKGTVLLLMILISVLYLVLLYLTGFKFGFYQVNYTLNATLWLKVIIPTFAIIISSEIIRFIIRSQNNKFADFICYLSCVFAELLIFTSIKDVSSFNKFMDLVGLYLFPALIGNLVFHYLSKRFGILPNSIYRVITTMYIYFIPYTPSIPDSLVAIINLFIPIVIYFFISILFEKKQRKPIKRKNKFAKFVSTAVSVCIIFVMIGIVMLISNQFRFGALVIATESMTGEINKGDMVVYESYTDQNIREGQVIVFKKDKVLVVHRVIDIEIIGDETRYYTKGDANISPDYGYIVDADIVGLTDFKIAYIGYPTLWLRELIPN